MYIPQVASVVGRAELVSALFFFLAFLVYVGAASSSNVSVGWMKLAVSITLAACSMLAKEPGITVLGLCVVYDVLKHWTLVWGFGRHSNPMQNDSIKDNESTLSNCIKDSIQLAHLRKRIGRLIEYSNTYAEPVCIVIGVLIVSGVLLMWFRMSMNFGTDPIFKPEEMRAAFHEDRLVR